MINKLLIGFGVCVTLCILVFMYYNVRVADDTNHSGLYTRQTFFTYIKTTIMDEPIPRNIFFLETSHIDKNKISLTARQCCAVESAALTNPSMKINLLIFTQSLNYTNITEKYVAHLKTYTNVVIRNVVIEEYIKNTPIEQWWNRTNVLKTSSWPVVHASDILRLLTIWKYGGIYFDLDVVVKSSFENISNFGGAEIGDWIANGIFGFETTGIGRQVLDECLQELIKNYRGDVWNQNGPRLITVVLQKICNTKAVRNMTMERCHGIKIYPPPTFYPIYGTEWQGYFNHENLNNSMKLIDSALAIHVWNALSSSAIVNVGSDVPYGIVANKYCPKIYNNCGKTF